MSKCSHKSNPAGDIIGKAVTLSSLVEYQTGAIVSREVLRKQTGTVTVFAFDEGQALSEHTAPFDALICALEGEADIFIEGKPHRTVPGQMIIMPANKPHAVKPVGRFKMMLVMIRS
jgi:quercetin dioxygenase-like cupin family protein